MLHFIRMTPFASLVSGIGFRAIDGAKRKNVTTFAEDTSDEVFFAKELFEICSSCDPGA
jgi:hypothetical protein